MVEFEPRFTEAIYLDTECYVPLQDRGHSQGSLIVNPGNLRHFLLGGVFRREFPLQNRVFQPEHIWNWGIDNEKDTLVKIYEYFRQSWKMIEGKSPRHPDLTLIGFGISRFDIPMIFLRSLLNRVDSTEKLYEAYFKTKIVDLGNVGIPLFPKSQYRVLYPTLVNDLTLRLRIENRKPSGKGVWDMYDAREFDAIKERTADEVEMVRKISSRIISRDF